MEKEASVYGNSDIASVLFLISERLFKRFKKMCFALWILFWIDLSLLLKKPPVTQGCV